MRFLKNTLKGEMPVTRFIAGISAACAACAYSGEVEQPFLRIPAKLNSHSGQREHPDP